MWKIRVTKQNVNVLNLDNIKITMCLTKRGEKEGENVKTPSFRVDNQYY